jgi:hypothetical protein
MDAVSVDMRPDATDAKARIRARGERIRERERDRALARLRSRRDLSDHEEAVVGELAERLTDTLLAVPAASRRRRLGRVRLGDTCCTGVVRRGLDVGEDDQHPGVREGVDGDVGVAIEVRTLTGSKRCRLVAHRQFEFPFLNGKENRLSGVSVWRDALARFYSAVNGVRVLEDRRAAIGIEVGE